MIVLHLLLLLTAAWSFVMDGPLKSTELRTHLACVAADSQFRGRFVSTEELHPVYSALVTDDSCSLDQQALVNAFSKTTGFDTVDYGTILDDGDVLESIGVEKACIFAAFKYRINGVGERKIAVGCFDSRECMPSKDEVMEMLANAQPPRESFRQNPVVVPPGIKRGFDKHVAKFHRKKIEIDQLEQAARKKKSKVSGQSATTAAYECYPTQLMKELRLADPMKAISDLEAEISNDLGQLLEKRSRLLELQSRYNLSEDEAAQASVDSLLYSHGGRLGHLASTRRSCGFITLEDLEAGIVGDVPADVDGNETYFKCGTKQYYTHHEYNCWAPWRKEIIDKTYLSQVMKRSDGVQALLDKFQKGERCSFDQETHDILSAYAVAATGASDWGKQSLIAGAFKAAFHIMDLDVSDEDLAKGMPSTGSISNWEFDLAAGSLASLIHALDVDAKRLKELGMKLRVTLMTDHGNRKGVDHLVKVLMWASVDQKTGKRFIRRYNLDIDEAGHKTTEVASAIAVSLKVLGVGVDDIEFLVSNITGDRGGGGAVQSIHPELVKMAIMDESSTFLTCMLHAMNKGLETASLETLGPQGLNHNTCFQLVYQAVMMLVTIKKQDDAALLHDFYGKTLEKFWNSSEWQERAAGNFVQAFDEMSEAMDKYLGDTSDEAVDELVKYLRSPTNIPHPNFGRWGSVSAAAKMVLKHWTLDASVLFGTNNSQ